MFRPQFFLFLCTHHGGLQNVKVSANVLIKYRIFSSVEWLSSSRKYFFSGARCDADGQHRQPEDCMPGQTGSDNVSYILALFRFVLECNKCNVSFEWCFSSPFPRASD